MQHLVLDVKNIYFKPLQNPRNIYYTGSTYTYIRTYVKMTFQKMCTIRNTIFLLYTTHQPCHCSWSITNGSSSSSKSSTLSNSGLSSLIDLLKVDTEGVYLSTQLPQNHVRTLPDMIYVKCQALTCSLC